MALTLTLTHDEKIVLTSSVGVILGEINLSENRICGPRLNLEFSDEINIARVKLTDEERQKRNERYRNRRGSRKAKGQ